MDYKTFTSGLSRQLALDESAVSQLSDSLITAIKNAACDLDSIAIPGFGRFDTHKADEFVAVDPADGVTKLFPPSISLTFTPGSMLKKRLSHE